MLLHPKIFKAQENYINWEHLNIKLELLEKYIEENNVMNIISILKDLVDGYKPPKKLVDSIFNENIKKILNKLIKN